MNWMKASLAGMVVSSKPIEANKTFLGAYANITPVKQNTWIYLDEDDGDILEFADKEGRQIRASIANSFLNDIHTECMCETEVENDRA